MLKKLCSIDLSRMSLLFYFLLVIDVIIYCFIAKRFEPSIKLNLSKISVIAISIYKIEKDELYLERGL
ncbi:MAG: hypothetical protein KY054_02555 [Candidatus Nealsonbacteria bacterium]|nr:hypothetical protein [Candidatus Nealsonbacteria bacterium]